MTSTTSSIKQRKLTDLRVIDLQRELRSFNITYDKKDLKGALLEKLRQALISRNLDPENYLFDISNDLKSISSDENNRNPDENGSHEINTSEPSNIETDSEQRFNPDYPVQTSDLDNENLDEIHRLDSMNSRDKLGDNNNNNDDDDDDDDDENIFLTIDPTTKQEDENNNEPIENNSTEQYHRSDEDFDSKSQSNDITKSLDSNIPEQQTDKSPTTNLLSTDNDNRSKSETNQHESNEEQPKKANVNKDQCHLWVSNIAKETHASHLKDLFSKYGKVLTTKVIGSSSSRWFGYINLATSEDVEKCINALHQTELHGKKIYVDREMYDEPIRSSSSKSNSNSTSDTHRKPSDHSVSLNKNQDSSNSEKKRSSSSSNENRKKFSSSDVNKSNDNDSNNRKITEPRRNSSSSSTSHSSRTDIRKSTRTDKPSDRSTSNNRIHSREKHSLSSSNKSELHRSSSIDKSKQNVSNKLEKPKDIHHRSHYESEQRSKHDKDVLERKQYVQHQEEEIKEQQRRLADERERMRREFEILERERQEIERTRMVLEKEKQDQARELEKQKQRHIADEAKRRHEIEDKIRDEKLQRLAHSDSNKRPRSSHHDSQRSHTTTSSNNNGSHSSNKGYDHRPSTNSVNERERNRERDRDRSLNERNRDYYPEPKRQYTDNSNNQREPIFRDRPNYRDSEPPGSSSSFGLSSSSSSSISSNPNNQRYLSSSSNPHRLSDPYNTIPPRGRDMALPPTSVSTAYERSSRNPSSSSTNPNAIPPRRPHSRERFDNREYMQQAQRRERSPISSTNTMRREPMETSHWERSKSRDAPHYNDDNHKYLPAPYLSESSQSSQQQGLWSAAPPSRQPHHHSDLAVKTGSHPSVTDPYNWQRIPQQGPPQSHHPQGLSSSHDRSRSNVPNNQRIPILPSNQPPPPPPPPLPPSSRGSAAGQTHIYSHPGVPLNTLPTSQQHASLTAPPSSLRHPTTYITQQAPPAGLVLHPTSQTRPYEQHYVVTSSLPQRRY